jgi:hypothetical protein
MCFVQHSQILMKHEIFTILSMVFICVFLQSQTYDGDPLFIQCHESIVTLLHDPKDFSSSFSKSSPSSNVNCDGILGSSSSCYGVPYLYSTSAS